MLNGEWSLENGGTEPKPTSKPQPKTRRHPPWQKRRSNGKNQTKSSPHENHNSNVEISTQIFP